MVLVGKMKTKQTKGNWTHVTRTCI